MAVAAARHAAVPQTTRNLFCRIEKFCRPLHTSPSTAALAATHHHVTKPTSATTPPFNQVIRFPLPFKGESPQEHFQRIQTLTERGTPFDQCLESRPDTTSGDPTVSANLTSLFLGRDETGKFTFMKLLDKNAARCEATAPIVAALYGLGDYVIPTTTFPVGDGRACVTRTYLGDAIPTNTLTFFPSISGNQRSKLVTLEAVYQRLCANWDILNDGNALGNPITGQVYGYDMEKAFPVHGILSKGKPMQGTPAFYTWLQRSRPEFYQKLMFESVTGVNGKPAQSSYTSFLRRFDGLTPENAHEYRLKPEDAETLLSPENFNEMKRLLIDQGVYSERECAAWEKEHGPVLEQWRTAYAQKGVLTLVDITTPVRESDA